MGQQAAFCLRGKLDFWWGFLVGIIVTVIVMWLLSRGNDEPMEQVAGNWISTAPGQAVKIELDFLTWRQVDKLAVFVCRENAIMTFRELKRIMSEEKARVLKKELVDRELVTFNKRGSMIPTPHLKRYLASVLDARRTDARRTQDSGGGGQEWRKYD